MLDIQILKSMCEVFFETLAQIIHKFKIDVAVCTD